MKEHRSSFEQAWNEARSEQSKRHRTSLEAGSWWHSIDLGGGIVTPGVHALHDLKEKYASFGLPHDLSGKRLLDVGCWDGFYSFEAERHGARVVSIDCFRSDNFFKAHTALNSAVEFHEMSVYELERKELGTFDFVLFLGVLYHLRHPLFGLERICAMTRNLAIIESHVTDPFFEARRPVMEFYEMAELGAQYDNWWGPNRECLVQMTRSAGFARVELQPGGTDPRGTVKAYRNWEPNTTLESSPSIMVSAVFNAMTWKQEVPVTGRSAFLCMYAKGFLGAVARESLRLHVGEFGIVPHFVGDSEYPGYKQINAPVPPGLNAGTVPVWIEAGSQRSNEAEVQLVEGTAW